MGSNFTSNSAEYFGGAVNLDEGEILMKAHLSIILMQYAARKLKPPLSDAILKIMR